MSRIFINYRRGDTSTSASRLYEWLTERYGDEQVFMDVDAIEPGLDWARAIESAVGSADLVLALIGDDWLNELHRRAEDEDDFMRYELETALRRDIRVIPVLVEGAKMPVPTDLPDSLKSLTRRQAFEVRDERFRFDKAELLKRVDRALGITNGAPVATDATPEPSPLLTPTPTPTPTPAPAGDAAIEVELVKWNWGAFLLTIVWGLGNGVYRAFLTLIPIYGIYEWIMLGRNGNRLAWETGRWKTIESFHASQRKWAIWGVVITVIWVLIVISASSSSS